MKYIIYSCVLCTIPVKITFYQRFIAHLHRNGHEVKVMRESKGGRFELVQVLDEALPSLQVNDTLDMENYHSATDGRTQRLSTNSYDNPHQDTMEIDNNRYHIITKRQQRDDDVIEYSSGTGTINVESPETATVIPITRATMIYVLCAALNSCNLGYDIGVSTNVSKLIQNDIHITDAQREIWIGFINFWASKWTVYIYAPFVLCVTTYISLFR
jgi:hypothetical protein